MSSAVYLEHCLDSLENLPVELQRNFTLMRDLDERTQDLLRDIDNISSEYLDRVRSLSPTKRTECKNKIQKKFNKAKEYGDDKVQLAIQTYELVDKHIRRLDSDLARFEGEIKDKTLNAKNSETEASAPKKGRKRPIEKEKKKGRSNSSDEDGNKASSKKQKKGVGKDNNLNAVLPLSMAHASDVLDMPVDPNEPTYCLCHQVSYGEMIGCDNPDCPIEWFHFACVGLSTKPKGKWFCPKCSADRKKK